MHLPFLRKSFFLALMAASSPAISAPVYLSCVIDSGPHFSIGSPLTFTFDETTNEVLWGNGVPAKGVYVTSTEISFLHSGHLNKGLVSISISRTDGRFSTTVLTMGGEQPVSGTCKLTDKTLF